MMVPITWNWYYLMNAKKQKQLIEALLSSKDIFTRCVGIIKPEYFDPEYVQPVKFILDYFNKHNTVPSVRILNAEFDDINIKLMEDVTLDEIAYTTSEVELFCQQSGLYSVILDAAPQIMSGKKENFGNLLERIQEALAITVERDMGIEMYDNPENMLVSLIDSQVYEPTGIKGLDGPLGGGLARKQFTLFSANSGGGKSVMLSNLGGNYARQGYHVVYISLELSQEMIFLRNSSIMTSVDTDAWRESIPQIAETLLQQKKDGAGSYTVKRMPNGSCANDIRAYLKLYEMEKKHRPDVLIVDYVDLMHPNGGPKNMSISEQDKLKSEQLAEIAHNYNAVAISASQQNREGIRATTPDQGMIAGGITKINTVDNYISIYMDPAMRLRGEMIIYFLKTRSSSAVGSSSQLSFNPKNLIISDTKNSSNAIRAILDRKKNESENATPATFPGISVNIDDDIGEPDDDDSLVYDVPDAAPSVTTLLKPTVEVEQQVKKKKVVRPSDDDNVESLIELMHTKFGDISI